MRRRAGWAGLALASLLTLPGCWFWVDSNPRDVEGRFASARAEVEKIQAIPASKQGKPHKVKALMYDRNEEKLISISAPMWLVRKVAAHAVEGQQDEAAVGEVKLHGLTVNQILDGSRGMLLEAQEADEQYLIWLE